MSVMKINLLGGVAKLGQFAGIGKGVAPAANRRRAEPFVGIGGGKAAAKGKRMDAGEDNSGDDQDETDDGSGDDQGAGDDDDQALDDDDYGADAPSDDDSPEEAEAKRASRVARKARRLKQTGDAPQDTQNDDDPPVMPPATDDADDPDSEMRGKGPLAAARNRERARCAAIFAHKAAAANPDLAAHLAFNTRMTRWEATQALAQGGSARGGVLSGAMAAFSGQRPGAPPAPPAASKALEVQKGVDAAMAAAAATRGFKK